MKKRKILAVTGNRADYGNLRPVLKAVVTDSNLELDLVVCGTHLSRRFGYSITGILADGFKVFRRVKNLSYNDNPEGRVESLLSEFSDIFDAILSSRPDFVLAFGDREEPLCCSIICNYLKIPFAHISGGDYAWGNADDMIRHAISKIAHIHFVTNKESGRRLLSLGEEPWRILNVGLPAVDVIVKREFTAPEKIYGQFNLRRQKPTIVVLNHPVSSQLEESVGQVEKIIKCSLKFDCNLIVIYPNSDPGSGKIIKTIKELVEKSPQVHTYPTLHHFDYLGLLSVASCLVGNSSSGIIESAYFGLPTLNVGRRETGRLHGGNVKYIESTQADIEKWLEICLYDEKWRNKCKRAKLLYGNGHASEMIVKTLKDIKIDNNLLTKRNTY